MGIRQAAIRWRRPGLAKSAGERYGAAFVATASALAALPFQLNAASGDGMAVSVVLGIAQFAVALYVIGLVRRARRAGLGRGGGGGDGESAKGSVLDVTV